MASRTGRLLKRLNLGPEASPLPSTMDKLNETLQMLEDKEGVLIEKASQEDERAKKFTRANNKRVASQCLKRKQMYESEHIGNLQLKLIDQMVTLEETNAAIEALKVLRTGVAAGKAMQEANNIAGDICNVMDQINKEQKTMEQFVEVVSAPRGRASFSDKDLLERKVEELEGTELGEQLLPAATASAAPKHVIGGSLRAPLSLRGDTRRMK